MKQGWTRGTADFVILALGCATLLAVLLRADYPSGGFAPPKALEREPVGPELALGVAAASAGAVALPSLVEAGEGRLLATWGEEQPDGGGSSIRAAFFDPRRGGWQPGFTVVRAAGHAGAERVANPVALRPANGPLWLAYLSFAAFARGDAPGRIHLIRLDARGAPIGEPRRLVASPLFGWALQLAGPGPGYADGGVGLLVSRGLPAPSSALLRLDRNARAVSLAPIARGQGAVPAQLAVEGARRATALAGGAQPSAPQRALAHSRDGGTSWSDPRALAPRGGPGRAALHGDRRQLLMAWNGPRYDDQDLQLALSSDRGGSWNTAASLASIKDVAATAATAIESAAAAADCDRTRPHPQQPCRQSYRDPYLLRAADGRYHLLYVRNGAQVAHASFTQAWLERQ